MAGIAMEAVHPRTMFAQSSEEMDMSRKANNEKTAISQVSMDEARLAK
jgi:hypothetical protein